MKFHFIPESNNRFLHLFPHRCDYLLALHCKPGEHPRWQTEDRHPLSDRMIEEGKYLYGVRFGSTTRYLMLDIDRKSVYHPKNDRFATGRIFEALEALGLTDHISITSSYTEGIHIYFPLPEEVTSWQIASVVNQLLLYRGFLVEDGLLEIFPNNRNYEENGSLTLFKGHRLPLQEGSYLLSDDWQLQLSSHAEFVRRWEFCQARNRINPVMFKRLLEDSKKKFKKLTYKAEKFLNDLHTEIEAGWSGAGQTNYILGRITLRAYIFGHYINGGEPLTGDRLIQEILRVAVNLPGFHDWCRHKHEIWQRAEDWARCVENSKYFPYGRKKENPPTPQTKPLTLNQFRREQARERICFAIADLLNAGRLPAGITERFDVFTREYGFSGETLYHHADLWHPAYLDPVENPPAPPQSLECAAGRSSEGADPRRHAQSLLNEIARNTSPGKGLEWFEGWKIDEIGCNSPPDEGFSRFHPPWGGGDG